MLHTKARLILVGVRYLRFAIFLSLIVIATGVFMPFVQVGVGGIALGSNTAIPLYDAVGDVDMVQSMAAKVEASPARRIADGLMSKFGRDAAQISDKISDLRSAAQDVRDIREEAEFDTIASAIKICSNLFLFLLALVAWMVLGSISQRNPTKRRAVATAIFMTIIGISSVALFFGVREALSLANDEIGISILSLGSGAYMMFVFGLVGTIAAISAAILDSRQRIRSLQTD